MPHLFRAVVLASAVIPLAFWATTTLAQLIRTGAGDWSPRVKDLGVLYAFGMPLTLAIAVSWGLPMILWLRRRGWLSPWVLLAWGALAGGLVAVALAQLQRGSLMPVRLSIAGGAALGGLAGLVSWWAVVRWGGRAAH